MVIPWNYDAMGSPWIIQNPMENSWISLMKFSWDISVRVGCLKKKHPGKI